MKARIILSKIGGFLKTIVLSIFALAYYAKVFTRCRYRRVKIDRAEYIPVIISLIPCILGHIIIFIYKLFRIFPADVKQIVDELESMCASSKAMSAYLDQLQAEVDFKNNYVCRTINQPGVVTERKLIIKRSPVGGFGLFADEFIPQL